MSVDSVTTNDPPAPSAGTEEKKTPQGPVPSLGVRIVGLLLALVFGAAFFFIARAAWTSDLATTNARLQSVVRLAIVAILYPAGLGLFALATGVSPPASANPLGIPTAPRWFQTLFALIQREVMSFFTTPVPYVVYTVFLLINGYLFALLISYYTQGGFGADLQMSPARLLLDNIFMHVGLWFICPALTMRLLAEEKRLGTIETLLTAPVTDVQVVLAKYAGACVFYLTMIGTTVVYLWFLAQGSREWDWGPVLSGYLAVLLLGGFYLAAGLCASSVTQSQIAALVIGIVVNIIFFFFSAGESFTKSETLREILRFMSIHNHFTDLLVGVVSTKSVVFFLSLIGLFLFFSVRGLESQRWK